MSSTKLEERAEQLLLESEGEWRERKGAGSRQGEKNVHS
jgi:hypothetical protein